MAGAVMSGSDPGPPGVAYYFAIALFLAVLAFALLGLVRSSSRAGAASDERERTPPPAVTPTAFAGGPVLTPQIPPPTPPAPTRPPSRTYLHPAPEVTAAASPEPGAQPRR
jgi:hypothetical protein